MEKIFNIATSVSTPLGVAGLILAILFYVILNILKTKNGLPIYSTILKYLFILSLVAMLLGFSGFVFEKYYENSRDITIKGIVFVGGQELSGIEVEILEARATTQTDPYGNFKLSFDKGLKQNSYSIKFTNQYIENGHVTLSIKGDSSFNHFYLKEKKNNISVAVSVLPAREKNNTKGIKKKEVKPQTIIVPNPKPPQQSSGFQPRINFDSLYTVFSGSELKLSDYGKMAYENENYLAAIKFLERAHAVESSNVWESNIPYLIASYWKENKIRDADEAIAYMYKKATFGPGYLNHSTTIGFLIQNWGYIRNTVAANYQVKIDLIVDKLVAIKKQVP
jgi:hypothetical protein